MEEIVRVRKRRPYKLGTTKAIIENAKAASPLSYVELAAALGCRPNTIYRTAVRLRNSGRIPPKGQIAWEVGQGPTAPAELATPPSLLDTPPSQWDEDTLAAIDKLPILNSEQRKRLLSAIGMRPSAGVGQAAALKTLEDIDKGAGTQIGPPPPLTEAQQIERLSRLMRAVGHEVAQKSMEAAFESSNSQETATPIGSETSSIGESDVA